MIFNKKICVIIPIKHSSQRVPGKNYRLFNNQPLYQYIVDTLLSCSFIDQIVIDTNSPIIKEGINHKYKDKNIIVYDRPENLCSHDTPVNNLLINVINSLKLNTQFDIFIQTHTTNPLLRKETISLIDSPSISTITISFSNGSILYASLSFISPLGKAALIPP